jgi:hypothetical protein
MEAIMGYSLLWPNGMITFSRMGVDDEPGPDPNPRLLQNQSSTSSLLTISTGICSVVARPR